MGNPSQTLPLDLDADGFRRLGREMLDLAAEWLASEPEDPVLRALSGTELAALFDEPPPEHGMPIEDLFAELRDKVMRHARHNGHPRYLAYVCASADPVGALAELLAATMNQNLTAWRSAPSAVAVERRVLRWLDDMVGFQGGGHGLLLGGGSAANLHAVGAALQNVLDEQPRARRDRLVLYVSQETHLSVAKAARFVGIEHVRRLAVDSGRRLQPPTLKRAIETDLEAGLLPAMVVGSAGTANAGTIDPLRELGALCHGYRVWFHVDGAYGAPAALLDGCDWMRDGFAEADSLSLDPHKWMYAPIDAGALLVRNPEKLRALFAESSEYIAVSETAPEEDFACWDYGLELSRRFRALKLWCMFKLRGVETYRRAIGDNIAVREYLDARVAAEPKLECMASGLSISCFRYRTSAADTATLNAINEAIQRRLLETGRTILSPTTLDGRYCLRVCIVNFRTRREDMDWLVDQVLAIGDEISG